MRARTFGPFLVCAVLSVSAALAQTMSSKTLANTRFEPSHALPPCANIAVQDGDPHTGPAIIAIRLSSGCVVPWHWHSARERVILLRGAGRVEMKDAPAVALHPGDFLILPAKHIHRFTAHGPVVLYNMPDGPFDIHYVDPTGNEIPLADALKQ